MTEGFQHAELVAAVAAHLPGSGDSFHFQPITTGKFNTSFFVRSGDVETVLRIAPPDDAVCVFYERAMMRQEPELHALLRARTTIPVAPVVAFDDSRAVIDRDFILMERLAGSPLTEMGAVDYDFVLGQIGGFLAQTHRITAGRYGYLGAHHPMVPANTWAEAFAAMWNLLIDDVVGVGFYDAAESRTLRGLLEKHYRLFDRDVPASLLHMDVWHQNILVDDNGSVTGLVDWDRAVWGDPEIEYAVLDYCGVSRPAFWEGYGQPREASAEAAVRRVFYLLYELQKYIVIEEGRKHDSAAAQRYKQQVLALAGERLLE